MSTFTAISLVNGLLRINSGCIALSASSIGYDGFSKFIIVAKVVHMHYVTLLLCNYTKSIS